MFNKIIFQLIALFQRILWHSASSTFVVGIRPFWNGGVEYKWFAFFGVWD